MRDVAGLHEMRTALEHGQVDELLLDPARGIDEAARNELVRLPGLTERPSRALSSRTFGGLEDSSSCPASRSRDALE